MHNYQNYVALYVVEDAIVCCSASHALDDLVNVITWLAENCQE